jgi:hypothetical protein
MTSSVDSIAKSTIGTVPWQTVGICALDELAKARWETINLIQWLTRIADSYVPDDTPQRRTELEFRASNSAFVTKPFDQNISLELRLPSLQMQFLKDDKPAPHIFEPQEHSPAEVEAWILVELLHRGIDREKFSKRLPYAITDLMSGDEPEHSPQACQDGLKELAAWFQNAAAVFEAAAHSAGGDDVRSICLPQTLALSCASGPGWKPADFGFLPGDGEDPEPLFYTSSAGAGGKRTILKASELLAAADPSAAALTFLKSAAG